MALKYCRECGGRASSEAAACPHCGAPNPTNQAGRQAAAPAQRTTVVVENRSRDALAGLASFFVPGLGQLIQGRVLPALAFFGMACLAWLFAVAGLLAGMPIFLGAALALNVWAVVDAAKWTE